MTHDQKLLFVIPSILLPNSIIGKLENPTMLQIIGTYNMGIIGMAKNVICGPHSYTSIQCIDMYTRYV